MTVLHVSGRGFGKRARITHYADSVIRETFPIPRRLPDVLPIASVRWICKRPTAPVYAVGTNGWLMEQYVARLTPEMRKHNRRIADENAAIMDRYADLLGVKPHGTNNSQVQQDASHR